MPRTLRLTRELVDLIPASIEDPGLDEAEAKFITDNYHQRTTDEVLTSLPDNGELWLFAYGSLIWKPRFTHDARRVARVDGWQRSFCMGPDRRYRGSPDLPGYMLSLIEGGSCQGVVFRLSGDNVDAELLAMIETEPPIPPVWLNAETPEGIVRCIGFVCPKNMMVHLGNPTEQERLTSLATAVGKLGSMPDYLLNTIEHLEEAGIHDPYLWEMQELVAERLERLR